MCQQLVWKQAVMVYENSGPKVCEQHSEAQIAMGFDASLSQHSYLRSGAPSFCAKVSVTTFPRASCNVSISLLSGDTELRLGQKMENGLNRGRKDCLNFLQMLQKSRLERLFRIKSGKGGHPVGGMVAGNPVKYFEKHRLQDYTSRATTSITVSLTCITGGGCRHQLVLKVMLSLDAQGP